MSRYCRYTSTNAREGSGYEQITMTREEYNEAHRRLVKEQRRAHKANARLNCRPKKHTFRADGTRLLTIEFRAWRETDAAKAWSQQRSVIHARFIQLHRDLKESHPEHNFSRDV